MGRQDAKGTLRDTEGMIEGCLGSPVGNSGSLQMASCRLCWLHPLEGGGLISGVRRSWN